MTAPADLAATFEAVLLAHQRIPLYDGKMGQRCVGCDNLYGETDGPNSPRHAAHVASALAAAVAEGGGDLAARLAEVEAEDGPECDTCGLSTCPDAARPEFSEPRECVLAPLYEALRYDRCEYGCGRDITKETIRRDIVPVLRAVLATDAQPEPAVAEGESRGGEHHVPYRHSPTTVGCSCRRWAGSTFEQHDAHLREVRAADAEGSGR